MSAPPLISIEKLQCRIGRRAVLRIDQFELAVGQHWCVFGPNGTGKSLLAAVLCGQRPESAAYVHYAAGFDPLRDCWLVSFEEQQRLWQQDNRLDLNEYSARAENRGTLVEVLIRSGRADKHQHRSRFYRLVAQLGLQDILYQGIRFLSSGQMRRVLIARALHAALDVTDSQSPGKLLVFDDPLEAIDQDSRQRIQACISEQRSDRLAVLLLCRRQQDILPGVTHLALMHDLQMLEQGERRTVEAGEAFARLVRPVPLPTITLPEPCHEVTTPAPDDTLIKLEQVTARYGDQLVLQDVNWVMTGADHVVIEGPNGCGKSTLLGLVDGDNHQGYGQQVWLFGQRKGSGETVWDIKSRFGVVSNELHNKYVKGWKVLDVVVSGFFDSVGLYDDSGFAEQDAACRWLEALGIAAQQQDYYHALSFGQQRLVLLARAMVKQPAILVLDEPCVGLDDPHRKLILATIDAIAAQTPTRIIHVSHVSDEQPDCINQRLRFVPAAGGGYTVVQQPI